MIRIKKMFKSFNESIKKSLWSLNNVLQRINESIRNFLRNIWHKITFYESRNEKKLKKYAEASEILQIPKDKDIRYDINLEEIYKDIKIQTKDLKISLKQLMKVKRLRLIKTCRFKTFKEITSTIKNNS